MVTLPLKKLDCTILGILTLELPYPGCTIAQVFPIEFRLNDDLSRSCFNSGIGFNSQTLRFPESSKTGSLNSLRTGTATACRRRA